MPNKKPNSTQCIAQLLHMKNKRGTETKVYTNILDKTLERSFFSLQEPNPTFPSQQIS